MSMKNKTESAKSMRAALDAFRAQNLHDVVSEIEAAATLAIDSALTAETLEAWRKRRSTAKETRQENKNKQD